MKKGLKASLLLASTLLLVACGSNESTEDTSGNKEAETTESVATPQTEGDVTTPEVGSNYEYVTADYESATDDQVNVFKDYLVGQSKAEDRTITQTSYLGIPKSEAREDEEYLIKNFGELVGDMHLVTTGESIKTVKGDDEENKSKKLYVGEAYVEEHIKKVGDKIYTNADSLLTLPHALLTDTPNLVNVLATEVEPGLAERLKVFEDKYEGEWLEEDAQYELNLNNIHTAYFSTLSQYLEDMGASLDFKVNDNKLYIELDPSNATDFETLLAGSGAYIDILFLDNGSSYIVEFDLESKLFSVVRPDSESDRTVKASIEVGPTDNTISVPSETETISDYEAYNKDFTEMIAIIPLEEDEQALESEQVSGPINTEVVEDEASDTE